jgi:AraC-like DNA-binding protein
VAPWGVRFRPSDGAGFHVVLQGACWLTPADGPPIRISAGDVVLLPNGRGHGLSDSPGTPLVEVPPASVVSFGSPEGDPDPDDAGGAATLLLCGAYRVDRGHLHPLMTELPDVVHLPARVGQHPALRTAVDLLGAELEAERPGSDAIVTSLLDALLLYILRAWFDTEQPIDGPRNWAAAINDPVVHGALCRIHEAPAEPWTVEALGASVGMSRAAFARRFTTLTGQAPLAYLTWWRMVVASRRLRQTDESLDTVARQVGYASEFAFAKAFKRQFGTAPGRYRRAALSPTG